MEAPIASIILPTRNRPSFLSRTLYHLERQTFSEPFEVLVVDNGPSDKTRQIVSQFTKKFPLWKHLEEPKPGRAAARNRGVRASQGKVLLFLDDDVVPDPFWLAEHWGAHHHHPDVIVLGSVRFPWQGRESPYYWLLSRRPELLQSFQFPDPTNVPFLHCYTCNLSLPRHLLSDEMSFDETFGEYGFEDIDLGYRLSQQGLRIIYQPEASALHDFCSSYSEFLEKRYWAGRSLSLLLHKHPELSNQLLGRLRSWRGKGSRFLGRFTTHLGPLYENHLPATLEFFLPMLGRMSSFAFENEFWKGYKDAESAD